MDRTVEPEQMQAALSLRSAPTSSALRIVRGYSWAVGGVLTATALFWLMHRWLDSGQASLLYLPVVIACAVRYGFGPAVLGAVLSFLCWDYFFLPPLYTLNVTKPHDLVSLMIFLIAAVTTGRLAARVRWQAKQAQDRLRETVVLYQASEVLSREIAPDRLLQTLAEHVVGTCRASQCLILRSDPRSRRMAVATAAGETPLAEEQVRRVLQTAAEVVHQRRLVRHSPPEAALAVPLYINSGPVGAMHVGARSDGSPFSSQDERLILTLANHAAIVIGREMQAQAAQEQARQAAVVEERNRLANDIHDTLSHAFTGIKFLLEAAMRVGPSQAAECLAQARTLAIEGAQEARRSAWALRPSVLEEAGGLPSALQALAAQQTAGTPLAATVAVQGEPHPLPGATEEHLLRICQEALTNVLRHAEAARIEITLIFSGDHVALSVKDDGNGFLVPDGNARGGFGFISMRERAGRIGGRLDVLSQQGCGTEVVVEVPHASAASPPISGAKP